MDERVSQAAAKLLSVYSLEQLEQLAELSVLVKDRAIIRRCSQRLQVDVNDKGWVLYFHPSDDVPAIKPPKSYAAE